MATKARFEYRGRERTVESVVRKSKQSGGSYDSFLSPEAQFFKAKEGENAIRILPPTWQDTEKYGDGWEIGVYLHYDVGPDGAAYLCLDKMKGETCPVCEARRHATDEEESDQLKAGYRTLCWVIDRDNEKAGPMVFSIPITLFKDINARSIDKKSNLPILIDDPEEGYDLVFTREGTKLRTKYSGVEVMRDSSPLHDDEKLQNRWLDYITENPLPELLVFHDAEHIEKVLFGKSDRRKTEDEEGEDTGRTAGRGRTARRRAEPEEAVEEEDTGRSRRSSRRSEPEEEPEDEKTSARTSRRRSLLNEEPEEDGKGKRKGTEEPEPEERTSRTSRRRSEPEPEPEEEVEEESTSSRARKKLDDMRSRRGK